MNDEHDERESVLATNLPTQSNCGDSCFNCGVESYACSHNVSSSVGAVFVIVLPGGDLLRFVRFHYVIFYSYTSSSIDVYTG